MDIAQTSMAMSQQQVLDSVGTSVLGMQLDLMEGVGDTIASSISSMPSPSLESLVNPSIGGNIDIQV